MNYRKITVTTTNNLEGAEINEYLGVISAHVVAGTNIFSDLLASLSDTFGGRSQSYQKQLENIKQEALLKVKKKASSLGGNAIVGLHIDMDEISGGKKSMFMVTASGTAVKAKFCESQTTARSGYIAGKEVQVEIQKIQLIEKVGLNPLLASDEEWSTIVQTPISELASCVSEQLKSFTVADCTSPEHKHTLVNRLTSYTESIDVLDATNLLYDALPDCTKPIQLIILKSIFNNGLVDFERIESMLDFDNIEYKKLALKLLMGTKKSYTASDLESLNRIEKKIKTAFPKTGKPFKRRSMLGKEKVLWECLCGCDDNLEEEHFCIKCGKDPHGFSKNEKSPSEATVSVRQTIKILNSLLAE